MLGLMQLGHGNAVITDDWVGMGIALILLPLTLDAANMPGADANACEAGDRATTGLGGRRCTSCRSWG